MPCATISPTIPHLGCCPPGQYGGYADYRQDWPARVASMDFFATQNPTIFEGVRERFYRSDQPDNWRQVDASWANGRPTDFTTTTGPGWNPPSSLVGGRDLARTQTFLLQGYNSDFWRWEVRALNAVDPQELIDEAIANLDSADFETQVPTTPEEIANHPLNPQRVSQGYVWDGGAFQPFPTTIRVKPDLGSQFIYESFFGQSSLGDYDLPFPYNHILVYPVFAPGLRVTQIVRRLDSSIAGPRCWYNFRKISSGDDRAAIVRACEKRLFNPGQMVRPETGLNPEDIAAEVTGNVLRGDMRGLIIPPDEEFPGSPTPSCCDLAP